MESWIVVFMGVIALCSIVQVAFLCTAALLGLRAMRAAEDLRQRASAELRQPLAHLSEAARNVRDVSLIVGDEARALQESVRQAKEQVREVKDEVRRTVRSPWVEVSAFAKGVSRAVSVFRSTPATAPAAPPAGERALPEPLPGAEVTYAPSWPRA